MFLVLLKFEDEDEEDMHEFLSEFMPGEYAVVEMEEDRMTVQ